MIWLSIASKNTFDKNDKTEIGQLLGISLNDSSMIWVKGWMYTSMHLIITS